jgi:hypothetical protein
MPKLVLTYFDLDGSRGEVARLAMHLAGIAFVDKRIAGKDRDLREQERGFVRRGGRGDHRSRRLRACDGGGRF